MSKLNIFSKDKLHIFFENYEHDNHLANIFDLPPLAVPLI